MNVMYKTSTGGSNPLEERSIDIKHFEEFIPLLLVDESSNLERTCDKTHTILRFSKKNNPENFFEFKITRER